MNSTGEIVVDNFAGGGGASTGIEIAIGRSVDVAINHEPAAIAMHRANHPTSKHYTEDIWMVDPVEACEGHPVGLAWFSPDCKHFSKAKGAAPVDRKIRGLAWIALRWAAKARPRVIILENVEEFQTWGPVRKGKPVKKLAGTTFRKFIRQLEDLGYQVEYRELIAADYGAPTSRKRFYLIARCDGQPIVWPEPTHSKTGANGLPKWRSAAEIIDWDLPCPSIFDSKAEIMQKYGLKAVRPLADNTMRRIIRGVDKFTIKSGEPFIVECNHSGGGHIADIRGPYKAITAKHTGGIVAPALIQYHTEQTENVRAPGLGAPINTVDASNRYGLTCANLVEYYTGGRPLDVAEPMHTVTSHDREAVVATHVVKFKGDNLGQEPGEPLQTVTASAGEFAVCKALLAKIREDDDLGYWPEIRALLNKFCGYDLALYDVFFFEICKTLYYIDDIGMRMLSPRELYNAMGFPPDYIIDRDYLGNEYGKSKQVARCGNAVCPPVASALVRANVPEWCDIPITTMAQLLDRVAI